MDIYVYDKKFFKEKKEIQEAILTAVNGLYDRIRLYEKQNIEFCRIFNDDYVKYDKHGRFFTFKCQKQHLQLRILYSYFYVEDTAIILIADYFIKKKNNKNYIRRFDPFNSLEPELAFKNSYVIMSKIGEEGR